MTKTGLRQRTITQFGFCVHRKRAREARKFGEARPSKIGEQLRFLELIIVNLVLVITDKLVPAKAMHSSQGKKSVGSSKPRPRASEVSPSGETTFTKAFTSGKDRDHGSEPEGSGS